MLLEDIESQDEIFDVEEAHKDLLSKQAYEIIICREACLFRTWEEQAYHSCVWIYVLMKMVSIYATYICTAYPKEKW